MPQLVLIFLASLVAVAVYTRWRNLHKTSDMEVGAIGFHDRTKVKSIRIKKDNAIVNALKKTKQVQTLEGTALP